MSTSTQSHKTSSPNAQQPPNGGNADNGTRSPNAAAQAPVPSTVTASASVNPADPDAPVKKTRKSMGKRKVFVVTGELKVFNSTVEAEKFLNHDPDAPSEFIVVKGQQVGKKAKISLR